MLKLKYFNLELTKKEIIKGIIIFLSLYIFLGILFAIIYLNLFIMNRKFAKIKFNSNKILNRNL